MVIYRLLEGYCNFANLADGGLHLNVIDSREAVR